MSAPVPMRSVDYPAQPQGRCLMVLLPGAGNTAEAFAQGGFVAALRATELSVDLVAANATVGYYANETLWPRIKLDVIDPARARGYEKVWFVGVSLGGMGSILTALRDSQHPVDGVLLLAPYLGDQPLIDAISNAGGLTNWDPGVLPEVIDEASYQRHAWNWLKRSAEHQAPSLYLGYGTEDKLERSARVLAAALPKDHVYRVGGGHNWITWKKLWTQFLATSDVAAQCARPGSAEAR